MSQEDIAGLSAEELLSRRNADCVVRFLFNRHGVRGEICALDNSVKALLSEHHYPRCINALLLELAAAAVLISATLKSDAQIMVQIHGGTGPTAIRYALVNINEDLSFYGSALLSDGVKYTGAESFKDIVGADASLIISVFPKDGNKWQGVVPLDGDSTAAALEDYFRNSEQLPSRFFIQADADSLYVCGLMLQIIPETPGCYDSLEHTAALASTLQLKEVQQTGLYEMLRRLYWDDGVKAVKEQSVRFKCVCSKERCESALMSLSHKELEDIAQDKQGTEMTCQHCGRTYRFSQDEVKSLLAKVSQ